jgi:hypothetical protein
VDVRTLDPGKATRGLLAARRSRSRAIRRLSALLLCVGCGGPPDKNYPALSDTGAGSLPGPSIPGGPITTIDDGGADTTGGATVSDDASPTDGTAAAATDTAATTDVGTTMATGDPTLDATFGTFLTVDDDANAEHDGPTITTGPLTTG